MKRAASIVAVLSVTTVLAATAWLWLAWAHRADHIPVVDPTDLLHVYWPRAVAGITLGFAALLLCVLAERRQGAR